MSQGSEMWPYMDQFLIHDARAKYRGMDPVNICSDAVEMSFRALQASLSARIHCKSMQDALGQGKKALDEALTIAASWERRHKELSDKVEGIFAVMEEKDFEVEVLKYEREELEAEVERLKKRVDQIDNELGRTKMLYEEGLEEIKDCEALYTIRTKAKIMRQFVKGESLLWKPEEAINSYLRCRGELEDLDSRDSEDEWDDTLGTSSLGKEGDDDEVGGGDGNDQVNKNAELCRSIDALLEKEGNGVRQEDLKELMQKTGFSMVDIMRKYIRYALNEKPFNPKVVAALIQFRKTTMLDDSQVVEILNEISRLIVKSKGPVVMNKSGYSEKGLRRKLAVQALFGKIFYLSEPTDTDLEHKTLDPTSGSPVKDQLQRPRRIKRKPARFLE